MQGHDTEFNGIRRRGLEATAAVEAAASRTAGAEKEGGGRRGGRISFAPSMCMT